MNTENRKPTVNQKTTLDILQGNFGLSDAELDRILFLNERAPDEPWIPADILEAIARQIGTFSSISVMHDKYIPELQQVIYTATVIDTAERSYTRTGSAKVGERPNGFEIDSDTLAQSRALNLALNAAGFNPFKAGAVVSLAEARQNLTDEPLTEQQQKIHEKEDEAKARQNDLAQIHALAVEKNLWIGKDDSRYREALFKNFAVRSVTVLDRVQRAAVIVWLRNLNNEDFLQSIPVELREEALIA